MSERLVEILRRKAGEWRALGEEWTDDGDVIQLFYIGIEVALCELALALEEELNRDREAA